MASSGSCQVQDSLSCGVCFERYDSSAHLPKTVPCHHTFCDSCVNTMLVEGDGSFECPACRGKVTDSDEVHTNLVVKDIIEAVIAKEKSKLFCSSHPSKECQVVCADCWQLLCTLCAVKGEHKAHTVDDVDNAKRKMRKRLTTAIETIANLEKATAAKMDKLAHYEQELNAIVYMITESINEWKKTQLQTVQQAIDKEIETSKAHQASLKEKLGTSDLRTMMTACKQAEENTANDVSLPKVNMDEMRSKLNSLCDTIQTLINDNSMMPSIPPPFTSSSPKNSNENPISWDFIVHLCSCAVPLKDSNKRPHIPNCVKRVAKMYNRNRNTQFLHVVHDKRKLKNMLICKTEDFIFQYDCSSRANKTNFTNGLWDSYISAELGFVEKWQDVLNDPEYATRIKNALAHWKRSALYGLRNGKFHCRWEKHGTNK